MYDEIYQERFYHIVNDNFYNLLSVIVLILNTVLQLRILNRKWTLDLTPPPYKNLIFDPFCDRKWTLLADFGVCVVSSYRPRGVLVLVGFHSTIIWLTH